MYPANSQPPDSYSGNGNFQGAPQPPSQPYAPAQPYQAPSPQAYQPQQPPPSDQYPQIPPQPPPARPASLRESFARDGYDVSGFGSDAELMRAVQSGLEELPELRELAEYGAQALRREQEQQAPEKQEPDYPQYDPEWEDSVRLDPDTGKYVGANKFVPKDVVTKANKWREWAGGLTRNPKEFIGKLVEPELDKIREQAVEQAKAEINYQREQEKVREKTAKFLDQHKDAFFVLDRNGKKVVDARTGREALTPQGETLLKYAAEAQRRGIKKADDIQDFALMGLERDLILAQQVVQQRQAAMAENQWNRAFQPYPQPQFQPQQFAGGQFGPDGRPIHPGQVPPPPTPQQINEAQKQRFLDAARMGYQPQQQWPQAGYYQPNRDATQYAAQQVNGSQNEQLPSFMDIALHDMKQRGMLYPTG